jgi:hypothetical protein
MQQKVTPKKPPDVASDDVRILAHDLAECRSSSELCRAIDASIVQNEQSHTLRLAHLSRRVRSTAVLRGAGHWVAEQGAPDQLVTVLNTFLAPYP